jgi:hypothetical protein
MEVGEPSDSYEQELKIRRMMGMPDPIWQIPSLTKKRKPVDSCKAGHIVASSRTSSRTVWYFYEVYCE